MLNRPPELNLSSRLFIRLLDVTSRWSRARSAAVALIGFAVLVVADYHSGATVSLSFFFLAGCAFTVWSMGERTGLAISIGAALISAAIRHEQLQHGAFRHIVGPGAEAWNLALRLLSYTLIGVVVNGLRDALLLERWHGAVDSLTGALNRAAFGRAMHVAVEHARREDEALVLAYMDLDGFKDVNDGHGHSAGDRVLKAFAEGASNAIRSSDLFARLGGDEFAVLLTARTCEEGNRVVELLHGRLTKILAATGLPVTCSMGAVVMAGRDAAADDGVIERADRLMYEAKRAGKNGFRLARGHEVGAMLRASYKPVEDAMLDPLLDRIDLAERGRGRPMRRVA